MRSGGLRKRLTLQRATLAADGSGGQAVSWVEIGAVWGAMEPMTGGATIAEAFDRRITHAVTLRYRADVATGMRLVLAARVFLVRSVVNADEAGRELELLVEEGGVVG